MSNIFRLVQCWGLLFAVFSIFTATNPLLAQWVQTNGHSGSDGLAAPGPVSVAPSAIFTVNSTGDGSDFFPGDGLCATSTIPPFECTLRAAIQEANALLGPHTINFSIGTGVKTIIPLTPLPTITQPVTIDGTTQPGIVPGIPCIVAGHPCIELNGSSAGTSETGLFITAGNSTVRGLVINRFSFDGIRLQTAGGNSIARCFIGTNVTGSADLGNTFYGVRIFDSPNNTIGGTTVGARNVISGNGGSGVVISGVSATGNQVLGNFIGADATGTVDLGNTVYGVEIFSSSNNTIGGTTVGARNVISGNSSGVVISGVSATGNQVLGNFIGTDATGTVGLGNSASGIRIVGPPNNTIGGTVAGAQNVISGNYADGILIEGPAATGNQVLGNFIGPDVTGNVVLGNSGAGVILRDGPSNNTIGGTAAGRRNVISGNSGGVIISSSGPVTTGNQVLGNFIGTNAAGTAAFGNGIGVGIIGASGNTIGGTAVGAGNVISGNLGDGVEILGASGAGDASGNVVQGNFIGTDVTGTVPLGNNSAGLNITSTAPNNTIGGTVAAARNIISGNGSFGIFSRGSGTLVQGNFIGTDVTGSVALGNGGSLLTDGVFLSGANSTIGGTANGAGNTIAFNGRAGVVVPSTGVRCPLLSNSIFSNRSLGIDLSLMTLVGDGVTPNDSGDADTGGNNLQNFPVLTSADSVGASITILGTFNSTANDSFRLEFFANNSCDTSGYGEGQTFIGSTDVLTDGSGNAKIHITFPVAVPGGKFITATATDTAGNTSEFSQCRIVEGTTSVGSFEEVPQVFALYQNYPNPFNPSTTLSFDIPHSSFVALKVYDILGREVAILASEDRPVGRYTADWNASDNSSGMYFYRLQAGDFTMTRKMLLVR